MIRQIFRFLAGNPKTNEERFIHFDGSSAYSAGFQRMAQSTPVQLSALVAGAYVIFNTAAAAVSGDASQLLDNTIPALAGMAAMHGYMFMMMRAESIYDLTGKIVSKNYLKALQRARYDLGCTAFALPVLAYVANNFIPIFLNKTYSHLPSAVSYMFIGVAAAGVSHLANCFYRYAQVSTQTITPVDELPPQKEAKPVSVLKIAPQLG